MLKYYLCYLGIYLPLSESETLDLIFNAKNHALHHKYQRGIITWNELRKAYYKQKYLLTEAGLDKKGLFDA